MKLIENKKEPIKKEDNEQEAKLNWKKLDVKNEQND